MTATTLAHDCQALRASFKQKCRRAAWDPSHIVLNSKCLCLHKYSPRRNGCCCNMCRPSSHLAGCLLSDRLSASPLVKADAYTACCLVSLARAAVAAPLSVDRVTVAMRLRRQILEVCSLRRGSCVDGGSKSQITTVENTMQKKKQTRTTGGEKNRTP
jgi:hypothetical protein